jgi:hypothetical protein
MRYYQPNSICLFSNKPFPINLLEVQEGGFHEIFVLTSQLYRIIYHAKINAYMLIFKFERMVSQPFDKM